MECCDKIINAKKEAYEQGGTRRHRADDEEKPYYLADYNNMYDDLFGQTGQNADESIFELQYRSSSANNVGLDQMYFRYNSSSSNGFGYLKASSVFGKVDNTGNGVWNNSVDQRLYEFLYDANSSSMEQFGIRKFVASTSAGTNNTADSKRDTRSNVQQNWIFYRLTDVMLMKAEALVQLYDLGGKADDDTRNEEAFEICKFVNERALSDANKSSYALKYSTYKDKMEQLVLAERARELCFEGKRWYDLLRYGAGYDINWVLRRTPGESLTPACTLTSPKTGRQLEVWTTEPGVQIYDGYYLPVRNAGVALETQHFPDSPNHPEFPTTIVKPGEVMESTTEFRFKKA